MRPDIHKPPRAARLALANLRKRLRDPRTSARAAQELERLDCELFLSDYEQAYAELRMDPNAWEDVLAERREWDVTLMDGLAD